MRNGDVRDKICSSGVRFWEVAEGLGITDSMFSKRLRHELSDGDKQQIFEIVERIRSQKEREA